MSSTETAYPSPRASVSLDEIFDLTDRATTTVRTEVILFPLDLSFALVDVALPFQPMVYLDDLMDHCKRVLAPSRV